MFKAKNVAKQKTQRKKAATQPPVIPPPRGDHMQFFSCFVSTTSSLITKAIYAQCSSKHSKEKLITANPTADDSHTKPLNALPHPGRPACCLSSRLLCFHAPGFHVLWTEGIWVWQKGTGVFALVLGSNASLRAGPQAGSEHRKTTSTETHSPHGSPVLPSSHQNLDRVSGALPHGVFKLVWIPAVATGSNMT